MLDTENKGWVKLYRKIMDNPNFKNPCWVQLVVLLLSSATHKTMQRHFGGKVIELKPGQLITSRESLAAKTNIHPSKVERLLNKLEIEQVIEQVADAKSRLITVRNWHLYQSTEPVNGHEPNRSRTGSEHTQEWEECNKTPSIHSGNFAIPSLEEVLGLASMRSVKKEDAESFWHHYNGIGWIDGQQRPIRNWPSKMWSWAKEQRARECKEKMKNHKHESKSIQEKIEVRKL